jgi:CheY-like chemotaxis protein
VFLMLTTQRLTEAARCRELGVGFVMKPVRKSELRSALQGEFQPLGVLKGEASSGEVSPGTEARGLRILVADDGEENRLLINGYLKNTGYVVDEAENGAIAVEKFKQGGYDLVLTDAEMPELDGYAATRAMRAIEAQRGRAETPILLLTAHAFEEARARSKAAGCTDHLIKPISRGTLLEAITRYTRQAVPAAKIQIEVEPWLKAIIPGYLEKRRGDIGKLRSAVETGDFETVRRTGHQLTGTGSSYGFVPITKIGAELELAAGQGDSATILAAVQRLEHYLGSVVVK